jgi:hypothetical protein
MTTDTEESAKPLPAVRVRWWLLALGAVPLVGTALLTGRLIWEQTVWTWERGPQMVGFSLAHGPYVTLLVAPFLLALWGAVALVLIVVNLIRKQRTDRATLVAFALVLLLFSLDFVPSSVWQRLFIRQMASSPRSADLLIYAAYDKDFRTVKASCRTESSLPRPTTTNGERLFTLPRLRGTCIPFSFLYRVEPT